VWPNSFETQCGTWAGFKLGKYLMSFTGDAKYGDWIERLAINGIGATIPMSADGKVLYHVSYNVYGYTKHNIGMSWTCCSGSRPMAIADYDDLIYFKDADNLYVNLFASSTVRWNHDRTQVTIHQQTGFPESSNTEFILEMKRPMRFGIKLRRPGWLAGPITATVNGKTTEVENDDHHWLLVRRKWRDGDRLSVTFPMKPWLSRLDTNRGLPAAIMYGPVVLAARGSTNPSGEIDFRNLDSALVPSPGEPLTYHLASDSSVLFRPFYAFKEGEHYFIYLDPDANNRTLPGGNVVLGKGPDIVCSKGWQNAGLYYVSSNLNATATYSFEGTGIRWLGCRYDNAGKAQVKIDGQVVDVADQYGPGRDLPFHWERRGLSAGKHSIQITVMAEKTEASHGINVNLAGFEVISDKKAAN